MGSFTRSIPNQFQLFISMKGTVLSTKFTFVLSSEDTLKNVDHLKMVDYEKFKSTNAIGAEIQRLAKEDLWQQIETFLEKHSHLIPFLKLQIEDAFLAALNLRNTDTIKYFLENGFKIGSVADDAALTVCYSLEYLKKNNVPLDLFKLVLSYGANSRAAGERDSETGMHLAAQYNQVPFLELLVEYGGDINAVNDDRETPLGTAIKYKRTQAINYLKSKGASEKWNI